MSVPFVRVAPGLCNLGPTIGYAGALRVLFADGTDLSGIDTVQVYGTSGDPDDVSFTTGSFTASGLDGVEDGDYEHLTLEWTAAQATAWAALDEPRWRASDATSVPWLAGRVYPTAEGDGGAGDGTTTVVAIPGADAVQTVYVQGIGPKGDDGEDGSGGGVSDHGALTGLGDDDHSQYALADGTRGSFASTAQGALAATAVQPGDPDRVTDAPSDDSTTTTITATDGVLSADVVRVLDSDPAGARATIIIPAPSEWPDQHLTLIGDDYGASIGYLDPDGPVSVDASGTAADVNGADASSDVTPDGVEITFADWDQASTVLVAWSTSLDGLLSSDLRGARFTNLAVNGSPSDVVVGVAITNLAGSTTYVARQSDEFSNGEDVQLDIPASAGTTIDPTDAMVSVFLVAAGGAPVAPTSVTFDKLYLADAAGSYLGWNSDALGTGELNDPDPIYGSQTHSWFDEPGIPGKSLSIFSDGTRLYGGHTPARWEWHIGTPSQIGGPLDDARNELAVVNLTNQALLNRQNVGELTNVDSTPASLTGDPRVVSISADECELTIRAATAADVGQRWIISYTPDPGTGPATLVGVLGAEDEIAVGWSVVLVGIEYAPDTFGWVVVGKFPFTESIVAAADGVVPLASGIVRVDAGSDLSTARPAGAGGVQWLFDAGTDPGASGENIVNGQFGDLWAVAAS